MASTYLTVDTAHPDLDTILMWVRDQYAERGSEFIPEFNDDRTQVLLQLKGGFPVNPTVLNAALTTENYDSINSRVVNSFEWLNRTPIPDQTITDYLNGTSPLLTLLEAIKEFPVVGIAVLDFGNGTNDASVTITGQDNIKVLSFIQVWIRPSNTQDHTPDEHMIESFKVFAGDVVPGVGFTIFGINTNQLSEPNAPQRASRMVGTTGDQGPGRTDSQTRDDGGKSPLIYGRYVVAWRWQ